MEIGILIVGSLRWDPNPARRTWRRNRLRLKGAKLVSAPIRYGRRAHTRGDSYTIVFSEELVRHGTMGTALAVPCKQHVNGVADLIHEAELLWAAERNTTTPNGHVSSPWGSCCLLVNPTKPLPREIHDKWLEYLRHEEWYGGLCRGVDEQPVVNSQGFLAIPWPRCQDGSDLNLDCLVATVTDPTLVANRYPTAQQIAAAWCTMAGRPYINYFLNNQKHKITTFQDEEILAYLHRVGAA